MKYCTKCGNPMEDGMVFCYKCGTDLKTAPAHTINKLSYGLKAVECLLQILSEGYGILTCFLGGINTWVYKMFYITLFMHEIFVVNGRFFYSFERK